MGDYTPLFLVVVDKKDLPTGIASFWDAIPVIDQKRGSSDIWESFSRNSCHQQLIQILAESHNVTGVKYIRKEVVCLKGEDQIKAYRKTKELIELIRQVL